MGGKKIDIGHISCDASRSLTFAVTEMADLDAKREPMDDAESNAPTPLSTSTSPRKDGVSFPGSV